MRRMLVLSLSALLVAVCGACGCSTARLLGQETKIASQVYATETASAAAAHIEEGVEANVVIETATPEPSPVPSATVTERPSVTPTQTATATSTPSPTPTEAAQEEVAKPTPDLGLVTLAKDDLPRGYQAIDAAQFGFSPSALGADEYQIETLVVYGQLLRFQFVGAGAALLADEAFVAQFDELTQDPDALLEFVIGSMRAGTISDQAILEGYDDMGDASMAMTALTTVQGFRLRMDVVVVRRDTAVAFVTLLHLDGRQPDLDLREVAELMDGRLIDAWEAVE